MNALVRWTYRFAPPLVATASIALAVVTLRSMNGAGVSLKTDPTAPPGLEDAVVTIADRPCITADELDRALAARVRDLGYSDWRITRATNADATGCATASLRSSQRIIQIEPALRPEVRVALEHLADQMVDRCLTRSEAVELVTTTLDNVGETNWTLRTDGPRGGPANRQEEIRRRLEAGCFLYGGMGWNEDGSRVYLIGGTLD